MVQDDTQPHDAQPLDAQPQDAAELAEEVRRLRRRVDRERQARRQAEDIAEEATGRLYRALRHLEREHDELSQLVAASTHDVKNPLATIKGFAELLASGRVTGADAEHMLGRLVVNAEFTGELIDGMLDVLEAGLRERAAEPADLDLVMDEVIAGVRSRHPRVQVEAARLGAAVIHPDRRPSAAGQPGGQRRPPCGPSRRRRRRGPGRRRPPPEVHPDRRQRPRHRRG